MSLNQFEAQHETPEGFMFVEDYQTYNSAGVDNTKKELQGILVGTEARPKSPGNKKNVRILSPASQSRNLEAKLESAQEFLDNLDKEQKAKEDKKNNTSTNNIDEADKKEDTPDKSNQSEKKEDKANKSNEVDHSEQRDQINNNQQSDQTNNTINMDAAATQGLHPHPRYGYYGQFVAVYDETDNTNWTFRENKTIWEMRSNGSSWSEIVAVLRRDKQQIKTRYEYIKENLVIQDSSSDEDSSEGEEGSDDSSSEESSSEESSDSDSSDEPELPILGTAVSNASPLYPAGPEYPGYPIGANRKLINTMHDMFPGTKELTPDRFFSVVDVETLALVEARYRKTKWMHIACDYANLTGRMVDREILKAKFFEAQEEEVEDSSEEDEGSDEEGEGSDEEEEDDE